MKYQIETSRHFKKAFKKCIKRGLNPEDFRVVANYLMETGTVPKQYKPHKLSGEWNGFWNATSNLTGF